MKGNDNIDEMGNFSLWIIVSDRSCDFSQSYWFN